MSYTTSPDYGKDTADVSITNPFIKATGSNNYAIYNRNGTFKYFDGKILGSPNYYNEAPNEVEYLYETKEYTDENNKYVILEWMRQQP